MNAEGSPRVLVILSGSLGDVCRGLVVLPALRKLFPAAHISWVLQSSYAPLFSLLKDGPDRIFIFERKKGWRSLTAFLRLLRELRNEQFDITLDMQRIAKSALLSLASGAPRRIGFHRKNSKEGNWLFQTEYIPARDEKRISKIVQYEDFLRHLGAQAEAFPFPSLRLAEPSARRQLAVVVGSSRKSKDWPLEHYQEFLQKFHEEYADVSLLLLGTKEQADFADQILAGLDIAPGKLRNRVGSTSLSELAQEIYNSRALMGPDSGPGHLAALVGVPAVCLFGPTEPLRVAPRGSESLAIKSSLPRSPCLHRLCPGMGGMCMKQIRPEMVLEYLRPFFPTPPTPTDRFSA